MMDAQDARRLVAELGRSNPDLLDLAERLSPALFVDPHLLRTVRTRRIPNLDVQAEADLWLGPMTARSDIHGFVFHLEVGEELRRRLGRDPYRLAESQRDLEDAHEWLAGHHRQEELIRFASSAGTAEGARKAEELLGEIVDYCRSDRDNLLPWRQSMLQRLPRALQESKPRKAIEALDLPNGLQERSLHDDPPPPIWVRFLGGAVQLIAKRSRPPGAGWSSVPIATPMIWVDGRVRPGEFVDFAATPDVLLESDGTVELDDGYRRRFVRKRRPVWRNRETLPAFEDGDDESRPVVVTAVDWSNDDRLVVATDTIGLLVFSARTWNLTQRVDGYTGAVLGVAWSPDDVYLATVGVDAVTRILDTATWSVVAELSDHQDRVTSVTWSPSGRHIVTVSNDRHAIVYETTTWEAIAQLDDHSAVVTSVAWSPDGARLATAGYDRACHIYDTGNWQRTQSLTEHHGWITDLDWSRDGGSLATACHDGTIRIYDTADWSVKKAIRKLAVTVAWSPGGSKLAAGSHDGAVDVFATSQWELVASSTDHEQRVDGLAWDPDGSRLASVGHDGYLRVLDATRWVSTRFIACNSRLRSSDLVLPDLVGAAASVDWSFDGRYLATEYQGRTQLYDTDTWATVALVNAPQAAVTVLSWSPLLPTLVSGDANGMMRIYHLRDGPARVDIEKTVIEHVRRISALAWSSDGQRLATTSHDGTTRVYDTETWQVTTVLDNQIGPITSAAWSPDGAQLAVTGRGGETHIYDTVSWNRIHTLRSFGTKSGWSHDGVLLATLSDERTIQLYETTGWTRFKTVSVESGRIVDFAWSPDSATLATVGNQTGLIVHSTTDWQRTEVQVSHVAPTAVMWLRDGNRLATTGADGNLIITSVADLRIRVAGSETIASIAGAMDLIRPNRIREILGDSMMSPFHRHRLDPKTRHEIAARRWRTPGPDRPGSVRVLRIQSGRVTASTGAARRMGRRRRQRARMATVIDVPFLQGDGEQNTVGIVAGPSGRRRRGRRRFGFGLLRAMVDASVPADPVHRLPSQADRILHVPDFGHDILGTRRQPIGSVVRSAYFEAGNRAAAHQLTARPDHFPPDLRRT